MRDKPTLRLPIGILLMLLAIIIYAGIIVWASQWIGLLHILLQAVIYMVLGIVWILPLGKFMTWMETGHFNLPPPKD